MYFFHSRSKILYREEEKHSAIDNNNFVHTSIDKLKDWLERRGLYVELKGQLFKRISMTICKDLVVKALEVWTKHKFIYLFYPCQVFMKWNLLKAT
jgi:hypothetical protein